ncbi:MAG TPA: 3D domain-containing protein [Casimicrobiaceae bacterium]|nr:3D domain-containing protein [Casimicrobiaceae bacterium]
MLALAAGSPAAAGPGTREHTLRAQENALASRLQGATLSLYGLDSQLGAARAKLGRLQDDAAALRAQQLQLAQQIAATKQTLTVSQKNLGANLRMLYEQGDTDPLAVFLGAESLNEAVSTIDGLKHVTDQSSRFVEASLLAQHRLETLRATLNAHRARIAASERAAAQTARTLASARARRLSLISSLRSQQRLKASQISELEAAVQRAQAKSQALTQAVAASGPVPSVVGDPSPAPAPAPAGGRTLTVSSTGYSLPGHTATGLPVGWGVVAVDPTVIPLGTRMTIPGYGEGVAADVGSGIRGATIDLWFPTVAQAYAWGRRTITVTLH